MLRTTVKTLLARRFRLATTAFAVLLGVAFMAGTLSLTETVRHSFDRLYANVYEGTDAYVRSARTTGPAGMQLRGSVPDSTVSLVSRVPGVVDAAGLSQGYAQLLDKQNKAFGNVKSAPTFGITWLANRRLNPFRLVAGRQPATGEEIVIDRSSARSAGYRVGDQATVLTQVGARRFTIAGIATFGTADNAAGASAVLFTARASQALLGRPGHFDAVVVVGQHGLSESILAVRIRQALPAGTEVLTGAAVTAEAQKSAHQMLTQFSSFLLAFALIALFVGSFVIYNTFSILVAQRSGEHALLRAIGASRRQVLWSVVGESVAVGAIAISAGIAAGVGVASGLKALLGGFGITVPTGRLILSTSTIVVSGITGLVVTLAAAVFPARRAAKVAPVAAMRESMVEPAARGRRRLVTGLAAVAAGLAFIATGIHGHSAKPINDVALGAFAVFIGVILLSPVVAEPVARALGAPLAMVSGMPGRLGRGNAMRNPKRTASTASSLMIGVTLVALLTVFAASAKRSYNASVTTAIKGSFVISGGAAMQGGFPPQLVQAISEVPGVTTAAGYATTTADIGTANKSVAGIDPRTYPKVVDLHVVQGSLSALGGNGVAVVDTLAASHHWSLGQTIDVRFAETGSRSLKLVAVYTQKIQVAPVVVGMSVYSRNVEKQTEPAVYVATQPGANGATMESRLTAALAGYPTAKVETHAQYVKDQLGPVNTLLALVDVLLAFAVLVALLGIANTLALSLFERTRELGLLRAVGMSRPQLRAAVRYEAAIVASFGTLMGLTMGTAFGYAMVKVAHKSGIDHFTVPGGQLLAIILIAGCSGVAAAALPARRAGRIDVLRAIASQ